MVLGLVVLAGLGVESANAQGLCGGFNTGPLCDPQRAFLGRGIGNAPIAAGGAISVQLGQAVQNAGGFGSSLIPLTTCAPNCGPAVFSQAIAVINNPGILTGFQQGIINNAFQTINNGMANLPALLGPIAEYSGPTNQAAFNVLQGGVPGQAVLDQTLAMANTRNLLSSDPFAVPSGFGFNMCGPMTIC
jgi:hypothetical protein